MKRIFPLLAVLLTTVAFTACPGPDPVPVQSDDAGTIWQPISDTKVGEWNVLDCKPSNYETVSTDNSVVLGLRGYDSPCLFQGTPLDVSKFTSGTKLRITVLQKGGMSPNIDIPFYSHLFIHFGDGVVTKDELQYMPFSLGSDYEAKYEFVLPVGVTAFNPVLGIVPAYIGGMSTVADQPTVQLKTVKVEVLQ